MNNNRRRNFRPRPQKNNFRRRNGSMNSSNAGNFNNGNMNFNRNGSMTNPHNVEKTMQKFQQLAKDAQSSGDLVLVEKIYHKQLIKFISNNTILTLIVLNQF